MPLLGYKKWERFGAQYSSQPSVIQRAILSAKASQTYTESQFLYLGKLVSRAQGGTVEQEDCELSRYACYLVAMNGDVSKTEVANAQSYFAVKARESEVILPSQSNRILELELELQLRQAEKEKVLAEQKLIDTRHYVVTALPEVAQQKILGYSTIKQVEYIDRTILPDGQQFDGVGITYIQKRYGFTTTKAAWNWLESIGCGKDTQFWNREYSAVETAKLPRETLTQLDSIWQGQHGARQRFIGE